VLIDGEYIETLNDNQPFKGSSNQRIWFFTLDSKEWFESYSLKIRRQQAVFSPELNKSFIVGILPKGG
ncbi:MAG: hypothetical protein ACI4MC_01100, partial [Candidatus Coproplasma sp.]